MNQEFREEKQSPEHASAHALPAKTRRDHWLTVFLTAVESKRKARLRGHTHPGAQALSGSPRHVWALGPGRAVKRGPKSLQDMCRASARRVEASPLQKVAMTARGQVLFQGLVNVRDPHLKLGLSPDS